GLVAVVDVADVALRTGGRGREDRGRDDEPGRGQGPDVRAVALGVAAEAVAPFDDGEPPVRDGGVRHRVTAGDAGGGRVEDAGDEGSSVAVPGELADAEREGLGRRCLRQHRRGGADQRGRAQGGPGAEDRASWHGHWSVSFREVGPGRPARGAGSRAARPRVGQASEAVRMSASTWSVPQVEPTGFSENCWFVAPVESCCEITDPAEVDHSHTSSALPEWRLTNM